ncbi:hypothetical protein AVEN_143692-1, partial [Araneus ventricosus]
MRNGGLCVVFLPSFCQMNDFLTLPSVEFRRFERKKVHNSPSKSSKFEDLPRKTMLSTEILMIPRIKIRTV